MGWNDEKPPGKERDTGMNLRHDNYVGKQRRKAYVLFYIRTRSETAYKARRAFFYGLAFVLLLTLGTIIALVVWKP